MINLLPLLAPAANKIEPHNEAKVKFAPFSSKGFRFWGLGFGVYNRLEKGANLTPATMSTQEKALQRRVSSTNIM